MNLDLAARPATTLTELRQQLSAELAEIASDSALLGAVCDEASRTGLRIDQLIGIGGTSLVFAASSAALGECVLKMPWVRVSSVNTTCCVRQLGHTGPFLSGPATIAEADELLRGMVQRMHTNSASPPLPRLLATLEATRWGGPQVIAEESRPAPRLMCAILEHVQGATLAELTPGSYSRSQVLAALARATSTLHGRFGPHGDLKPQNIVWTGSGVMLIDPLPTDFGWGTSGFGAFLPVDEVRDLVALAETAARMWGATMAFGEVESRVLNRHNGRFGRGWETLLDQTCDGLPGRMAGVPQPLRDWACRVAMHAALLLKNPTATRPIDWSSQMLDELECAASASGD